MAWLRPPLSCVSLGRSLSSLRYSLCFQNPDHVPVVRRFSGGGTVIFDQGTLFVTFICNKTVVAGLLSFPRDIMSWTGQLYGKVFRGFGEFHLRESGGGHTDFLSRLSEYMPSRSVFTEGITAALGDHFTVQNTELETADDFAPSTKSIISSKEPPTAQRTEGWPR